ncbi:MAG: ABC transporter permease [Erysipelotrichaceae bacterium]|jgi:spermidine/putrescine transport system permease protein|nr:ABC transporter permease [Erysipelotrichaceae bacterium]
MVRKILAKSYVFLILLILYLPILVLIVFSFTEPSYAVGGRQNTNLEWNGFSVMLYGQLFKNKELMTALGNTILIAVISAFVATVLGSLGAIGAFYSSKKSKKFIDGLNQIPVANAEIIMAISIAILFTFLGSVIFKTSLFNFWTLLIGHVVLSAPFVYLNVKPKLAQLDPSLYEAALDLGAKPRQALFKIILPEILPGIFAGFILAITLSLDDFIMTAFLRGPGLLSGNGNIDTLSTYVQSKLKLSGAPAELRALTAIIFLIVITIVVGIIIKQNRSLKSKKERRNF